MKYNEDFLKDMEEDANMGASPKVAHEPYREPPSYTVEFGNPPIDKQDKQTKPQ